MLKKYKEFCKLNEALKDDAVAKDQLIDAAYGNVDTKVYDDKFLAQTAKVIYNALEKKVGKFGIYSDVIYVNKVAGVWLYNTSDIKKSLIACKNGITKTVYLFKNFDQDKDNTADVVLSTEKLGFTDMLADIIEFFEDGDVNEVSESLLLEASIPGQSDGYTNKNLSVVEAWPTKIHQYVFDQLQKGGTIGAVSKNILAAAAVAEANGESATAEQKMALHILKTLSHSTVKYGVAIIADGIMVYNGKRGKFADVKKKDMFSVLNPDTAKRLYKIVVPCFGDAEEGSAEFGESGEESGITVERGVDVSLFEDPEKVKAQREAQDAMFRRKLDEFKDTNERITRIITAFCHYVKQNGVIDNNDRSNMLSRGLYIVGKAGAGKSFALTNVLESCHMDEDRDYVDIGSGVTSAKSLYTKAYTYNGKLLIMDDSGGVVSGSNRITFWKHLLQTVEPEAKLQKKREQGKIHGEFSPSQYVHVPLEVGDKTTGFYRVDSSTTRKDRYFAEIGRKSKEEKFAFIKKRCSEAGILPSQLGDPKNAYISGQINDEWNEIEANTRPLIPEKFVFTGCVVIIGNESSEELKKIVSQSGGKENWNAIKSRFQFIEVDPAPEIMWNSIKSSLMEEKAKSEEELPDIYCTIPRADIDDFCAEVDDILSGKYGHEYNGITWRLASQMGIVFRGDAENPASGRATWKQTLRDQMKRDDF